jgi:hypothetical protein
VFEGREGEGTDRELCAGGMRERERDKRVEWTWLKGVCVSKRERGWGGSWQRERESVLTQRGERERERGR